MLFLFYRFCYFLLQIFIDEAEFLINLFQLFLINWYLILQQITLICWWIICQWMIIIYDWLIFSLKIFLSLFQACLLFFSKIRLQCMLYMTFLATFHLVIISCYIFIYFLRISLSLEQPLSFPLLYYNLFCISQIKIILILV